MKVFISHSFNDEDLAVQLKKILETSDQIKEAYMAQRSPNYDLEISQKIINQINDSDYLVAIITKENCSPSVHQELGFAQGVEIPKIPLIEKKAKGGVFLEGKDVLYFDKRNFRLACKKVTIHILEHGPTKKPYSKEEEIFVQKSAHYRFNVDYELLHFISSLLHLLNLEPKEGFIFLDDDGREKAGLLLQEFINDKNIMIENLMKFELRSLISIRNDFELFRRGLENAARFPHLDLFPKEQDALVKLNERVAETSSLDVSEHLRTNLKNPELDYDWIYQEIVDNNKNLPSLPMFLAIYALDLRNIIKAIIRLNQEFLKLRRKFGEMSFINTWDDETA